MPQASSHPPKTMSHLPSSLEDLEMAERRLIFHSTGGNRENGERKPALFSLFPPVRVLKKTKLIRYECRDDLHHSEA